MTASVEDLPAKYACLAGGAAVAFVNPQLKWNRLFHGLLGVIF
jgi:hypothetical protein